MWDIVAGILLIALLSLGLFWCGLTVGRRWPRALGAALALAAVVFILWFALAVHGTLAMARLLPWSNVIVLGNWIPLAAALLAGIVGGQEVVPLWRRLAFTVMMIASAWYTNYLSLARDAPPSRDLWSSKRVCLQTTDSSCSACCAVMVLRECGIVTNEHEMIDLCLTGRKGTPTLGLYRGLKAKTAGTDWDVKVVRGSADDLAAMGSHPMILLVTLDGSRDTLRANAKRWLGGPEITDHAIVLYRFTEDGRAIIGDPAGGVEPYCGRYTWNIDRLKDRWGGEGLQLVPRQSRPSGTLARSL